MIFEIKLEMRVYMYFEIRLFNLQEIFSDIIYYVS